MQYTIIISFKMTPLVIGSPWDALLLTDCYIYETLCYIHGICIQTLSLCIPQSIENLLLRLFITFEEASYSKSSKFSKISILTIMQCGYSGIWYICYWCYQSGIIHFKDVTQMTLQIFMSNPPFLPHWWVGCQYCFCQYERMYDIALFVSYHGTASPKCCAA